MDWLKKFYDKLLLLVISVIAIAGGALLLLKGTSFASNFPNPEVTKKKELEDTGNELTKIATEKLGVDHVWSRKEVDGILAPLTVSVPIVELEDGTIVNMVDPKGIPLRPDVPNKWLFDNKIEFTQLRLAERGEDPFVIKVGAFIDPQIQITRVEPQRKSWFLAVGESFPDSGDDAGRFTIQEHIPKTDPNGRDVGELVIADKFRTEDSPFTVVRNTEENRPIYFAKFVYKHKGTSMIDRVDVGATFTLPGQATPVFTLKEVRADYAIVSHVPEGKTDAVETRIPLDK